MTRILIIVIFAVLIFSSCSQSYYIVRHAEKANREANMSSDVPLTYQGKERAERLKDILKEKRSLLFFQPIRSAPNQRRSPPLIIFICQ
jgi:uncharacterized protein YciW